MTACRSGEVIKATWEEVDLKGATWTVPADRMKADREHRVPLSPRCVAILREALTLSRAKRTAGSPVFMLKKGKTLYSLLPPLKEVRGDATVHGFRSSFRDWAGEQTNAEHAVMEAALAHTIPNKAETAYARSDLFEKRRKLMADWAEYIAD